MRWSELEWAGVRWSELARGEGGSYMGSHQALDSVTSSCHLVVIDYTVARSVGRLNIHLGDAQARGEKPWRETANLVSMRRPVVG